MAQRSEPLRIAFLLGDSPRCLQGVDTAMTVLDYLRTHEGLRGTKEGCAEGDCGACTVVLAEPDGAGLRYRAVNACILFVPALHGKQLLTVEHLAGDDGALHPVQRAMVERHGSQCGFCTPGFVMSLFALYQAGGSPDRQAVNDALAGNLCRCTGYRPIVDAALDVCDGPPQDRFSAKAAAVAEQLRAIVPASHSPVSADALAELLLRHPDAMIVAGGTDVGLLVTKQHKPLPETIFLDAARDMGRVEEDAACIRIGAAATYEQALQAVAPHYPDFAELIRRIGCRQIRERGTIGGNLANASPIGDTPPALIALDAALVLRRGSQRRTVPVDTFFAGYRATVLQPGEFIERIDIPKPAPGQYFRAYKVSKRFDQDISAVCGAFRLTLTDGAVRDIRIGFGGVAATPVRVRAAEQALIGGPWTEPAVRAAMAEFDHALSPLSDMRATAAYRSLVARNLLLKCFLETSGQSPARTRILAEAV